MKSTTVEVTTEARNAADEAINTVPREKRPTVKDFASSALIEKAKRFSKPRKARTDGSKP